MTGTYCETEADSCVEPSPCKYGQQCVSGPNGPVCQGGESIYIILGPKMGEGVSLIPCFWYDMPTYFNYILPSQNMFRVALSTTKISFVSTGHNEKS